MADSTKTEAKKTTKKKSAADGTPLTKGRNLGDPIPLEVFGLMGPIKEAGAVVKLRSLTPYLMSANSDRSVLDQLGHTTTDKKAPKPLPEEIAEDLAFRLNPDDRTSNLCIPIKHFKGAIKDAATNKKFGGTAVTTLLKKGVRFGPKEGCDLGTNKFEYQITYGNTSAKSRGGRQVIIRPIIYNWEVEIQAFMDLSVIDNWSPILQAVEYAGRYIGIGANRKERGADDYGLFEIVEVRFFE